MLVTSIGMFMTYFKQTCDKPYDRHKYKLVFKNRKAIVFDDWDLALLPGLSGVKLVVVIELK